VTATTGTMLDDRQCLGADSTDTTGEESDGAHRCIVGPRMRPFTVITIVLLLLALSIAGIVFVIQLVSVT
jgi:1,4-dihydroxy-2-naphthoate octaprenyltransferase